MTQENKELLLKDLSARLLYRVICHIEIHHKFTGYVEKGDLPLNSISIKDSKCDFITCWGIDIDYVKPYLRSISSMTEEEKHELYQVFQECPTIIKTFPAYVEFFIYADIINSIDMTNVIDWLNAHHLDYRGLIPKGLAIEAPEGMYNVKEK